MEVCCGHFAGTRRIAVCRVPFGTTLREPGREPSIFSYQKPEPGPEGRRFSSARPKIAVKKTPFKNATLTQSEAVLLEQSIRWRELRGRQAHSAAEEEIHRS